MASNSLQFIHAVLFPGGAHKVKAGPLYKGAAVDKGVKPGATLAQDIDILQKPEQDIYILQDMPSFIPIALLVRRQASVITCCNTSWEDRFLI